LNNQPLGWARITHPFHPLCGKNFPILKARRVAGVDRLSLRGSPDGSLAIPLEWTDQAPPSAFEHLGMQAPILDTRRLLELVELVQQLKGKTETNRHAKKDLTDERI
jgi:hypothetical protein